MKTILISTELLITSHMQASMNPMDIDTTNRCVYCGGIKFQPGHLVPEDLSDVCFCNGPHNYNITYWKRSVRNKDIAVSPNGKIECSTTYSQVQTPQEDEKEGNDTYFFYMVFFMLFVTWILILLK